MSIPSSYSDFLATLEYDKPLGHWPNELKALWFDAKGNWEASHDIAQEIYNDMGSWVHGYLHKKEGDEWNAKYWYGRANRAYSTKSLEEEFKEIVEAALARSN